MQVPARSSANTSPHAFRTMNAPPQPQFGTAATILPRIAYEVGGFLVFTSFAGTIASIGMLGSGHDAPEYRDPDTVLVRTLAADPELKDLNTLKKMVATYVDREISLAERGAWNKPGAEDFERMLESFQAQFGNALKPPQEQALQAYLTQNRDLLVDVLQQASKADTPEKGKEVYRRFVWDVLPPWVTLEQKMNLISFGNGYINSMESDLAWERNWPLPLLGICLATMFGCFALSVWGQKKLEQHGKRP